MSPALDGVRVVDASTNLAGPLAAMVLGDLGADVVKVERLPHGDDTRVLPPLVDGRSPVFLAVNRGKRSVALDLRDQDAKAAYLRVVERADVVVDSFGPGAAERLGVAFSDLVAVNPTLVHCSVSAFGNGPIGAKIPGYDALVQAFTGMMSITGEPGGAPVRVAPSAIDLSTGLWATINILVALHERDRRAAPHHIEAALVDSSFALMGHQVIETLMAGTPPARQGSAARSAAPNEAFRTRDGWVMIATANDRQFRLLCEALELPALASDPRFLTITGRVDARSELHALIEEQTAARTRAEVVRRLANAGVPAGPIQDLHEALRQPLTAERGLVHTTSGGGAADHPALRLPLVFRARDATAPAPALGAHTAEVLTGAGCPDEVVRRLSGG